MPAAPAFNKGRLPNTPITRYYSGTDTLLNGYAVAYDTAAAAVAATGQAVASTAADNRERNVVKPTWANLIAQDAFAGVVCEAPRGGYVGPCYISIIPHDGRRVENVNVYTDENVAAGDLLAPIPESYKFGRAVAYEAVFQARAAADRSVTNGTVNGMFGPLPLSLRRSKIYDFFDDFTGVSPIFLGGATPAEFKLPGYMISGSSVAVAGTSDHGGRIALTPNSTNIAQLNAGGIAAGTASSADLLPFTCSAGKSAFFRAKANFGVAAVDSAVFLGLSISGACVSNAAVPATDDYLGFFRKVDDDGSLFLATNRDNGSDSLTDTGINSAADTMYDVAFLVRNRLSGDTAGYTTIQAWIDGTLVATVSSAAINALINKDEAMGLVFGGIDGAAAVVLELDRWELRFNK